MGLSGLEIYKLLPKKNCKECGPPTCLAFAMQLASGKTSLDACPYVSDEAKEALDAAAAPPIKLIKVGREPSVLEIGNETELFRHEKTFYHPTGVAIRVADDLSEGELKDRLEAISDLAFERVGQHYAVDLVALECRSKDPARFAAAAKAVADRSLGLVLISKDLASMAAALAAVGKDKPLICGADGSNYEEMAKLAKEHQCPLVVQGEDLGSIAELVKQVESLGCKDLILDGTSANTSKTIANLIQFRKLALKRRFRPFGYPALAFATEEDPKAQVLQGVSYMAKYGAIVVLDAYRKEEVLPLLTWRANLYSDPQKPIQVESKVHAVGDVNGDSPVYLTTNFSLTYYSVEGEVEASKVPGYILPVNTDGTSVLTAWAAGKLEPEDIAKFMKECKIEEKVNHRNVIIPGQVAVISGRLQEASGWNVLVGPREAAGIPAFAKAHFA
ncbi:MAG: acetyl-CoA decarbonylase/synthase complex subunit gamma [Limnochordia bacterium]|jgi:acetyl-CoA decarbonylase/synthase complex subunit gamma